MLFSTIIEMTSSSKKTTDNWTGSAGNLVVPDGLAIHPNLAFCLFDKSALLHSREVLLSASLCLVAFRFPPLLLAAVLCGDVPDVDGSVVSTESVSGSMFTSAVTGCNRKKT